MRRMGFGSGVAALIGVLTIALTGGAAAPAGAAPACRPASNIEAIIDDSGSMSFTDNSRLRVQAMDLLINALPPGATLGAIEFGSADEFTTPPKPAADPVFNPEAVGANASAMKAALNRLIQADNGATDYNAAFETARAANPGAQARIFLTDGGHDEGPYLNAHLNPTPPQTPTYVVGFSPGLGAPEDQARLQQIAADTGGRYFPLADSSGLQPAMDTIETILTCQTPPKEFVDNLAQGRSSAHALAIGAATRSVQISLTWTSPLDAFKLSGLRLVSNGRVKALARTHPRKLRVKKKRGSTFLVLTVSGLSKGSLRFNVKATKVGSGSAKAKLTTQVSQKSHR